MENVIKEYFEALSTGDSKSLHTIRGYRGSIDKLVRYFDLNSIEKLNGLKESDFMDFYSICGTGNTLRTHIRNLSAFFHWMSGKYVSDNHPFFNVKFGGSKYNKVPRKVRTVLTKEEKEKIISAGRDRQERFMMALALKTALRRSEIAGIKLSNISGRQITITGKGGDQAHTFLNDRLNEMLKDYLENERNTSSEYLFYGTRGETSKTGGLLPGSVNTRVKACAARAGITKKVTAHTTRRTAITWAAVERSPLAAQMLARHKSMKTTLDCYVMAGEEFVQQMLMESD